VPLGRICERSGLAGRCQTLRVAWRVVPPIGVVEDTERMPFSIRGAAPGGRVIVLYASFCTERVPFRVGGHRDRSTIGWLTKTGSLGAETLAALAYKTKMMGHL